MTPRLGRRRAALLGAYVLAGMVSATWGPRLPALQHELHVGTGAIGGLLAVASVGLLIGLLACSAVVRRLGERITIGAFLAVAGVGLATVGAGAGLHSALLAAVGFGVVGLGSGVVDVAANVDAAAVERLGGRSFVPLLHALWLVGAAGGSGIGAACIALGIPVEAQLAGEAAVVVVAALPIALGIPRHAAEPPAPAPVRSRLVGWLRGWTEPRILLLGVLIFGVELAEGSARVWFPTAFAARPEETVTTAALITTLFSLATAGFRALSGPVVDRFGRVAVSRVTISVGIVGVVVVILSAQAAPWLTIVGTILWAIGNAVAGPLGMAAAADGGAGAAARVGVVSSIGFAAGLAGPPVIGTLAQQIGLNSTFWVLAAFLVVALVAAPALRAPTPHPREG